jgi:hypothetical protein
VNKIIIATAAISTTLAIMLGVVASPFLEIIMESTISPSTGSALRQDQSKFLLDVSKLIQYADNNGLELTGGELYRTAYQQRRNILKGLSWTMKSKHMQRKAIDLFVFIDNKYKTDCDSYRKLGDYWESLSENNTWGGRWKHKDCVHFQRD